MIIGIVGKMESGKTTVAKMIKEYHQKTSLLACADPLKEMIINAGICKPEEIFGKKTKFSRLMMQKIGTEIFRKQVDPDFWIKKLDEEITKIYNTYGKDIWIIIHDVRFLNEAKLIKDRDGIIVKIYRPTKKKFSFFKKDDSKNKHASEVEQDKIEEDLIIFNDEGLVELKTKVNSIVEKIINIFLKKELVK